VASMDQECLRMTVLARLNSRLGLEADALEAHAQMLLKRLGISGEAAEVQSERLMRVTQLLGLRLPPQFLAAVTALAFDEGAPALGLVVLGLLVLVLLLVVLLRGMQRATTATVAAPILLDPQRLQAALFDFQKPDPMALSSKFRPRTAPGQVHLMFRCYWVGSCPE